MSIYSIYIVDNFLEEEYYKQVYKKVKEITKKESDKLLKMDKGSGQKIVGKFEQKDSKTMQIPLANKKQMKQIRKNISEGVRDFISKNITKKSKGGLMDYYKDIL